LHALFFNIYNKVRHKKQQKMSPGSSILSLATLVIICITPLPSEAQSAQKAPCYIQGDGLVDDNTKKALGFFDPDGFTEAQGVKKALSFDKKMEGGQSKTYGICSVIIRQSRVDTKSLRQNCKLCIRQDSHLISASGSYSQSAQG